MNKAEMGRRAIEQESKENEKQGRNNRILLKIIRHGEKDPSGGLTDYGRKITSETAKREKEIMKGIDKIKVVGSNAGPKNEKNQARALETADIYADSIIENDEEVPRDEVKKYMTRPRSILEIKSHIEKTPFNWQEEYKSNLPANFDELNNEDKAEASAEANEKNLTKILTIPSGERYRQEIAARYSLFINRYIKMIDRLDSDNKIMYPSGAHGGHIEIFLQKCLKRRKDDGSEVVGFENSEELGGSFRPSEGFFIDIKTDENGKKEVNFSFENGGRFEGEELSLDLEKMDELIEYYNSEYKK